jgi:hypothetical protein
VLYYGTGSGWAVLVAGLVLFVVPSCGDALSQLSLIFNGAESSLREITHSF